MLPANNIAVVLGQLATTQKIASSPGVDIRESPVNGRGLFATRSVTAGDVLVTGYMTKQNTDDPRVRWEQSESCRYTNHADNPNAIIRKLGKTVELVADESIQPNEEITVNYKDANNALGKGFFFTYRGKPYGNTDSDVEFMQKTAASRPATFYGLSVFPKQAQTGAEIVAGIAADVWEKLAVAETPAPAPAPAPAPSSISQAVQPKITAPATNVKQPAPAYSQQTAPHANKSLYEIQVRLPEYQQPNPAAAAVPQALPKPYLFAAESPALGPNNRANSSTDPAANVSHFDSGPTEYTVSGVPRTVHETLPKPLTSSGLVKQLTQESLYDQLEAQGYYKNVPGGTDAVISRAIAAAAAAPVAGVVSSHAQRDGALATATQPPVYTHQGIKQKYPVFHETTRQADAENKPYSGSAGLTNTGKPYVSVTAPEPTDAAYTALLPGQSVPRTDTLAQHALEHELTHASRVHTVGGAWDADRNNNRGMVPLPSGYSKEYQDLIGMRSGDSADSRTNYMRTWVEVDPRLAEIKREYSRSHPGTTVDTPEEAQNAWNWFLQEGHKTHANPVLYNHDIPMWQRMPANPEELHKQLMQRMPHVVKNQHMQNFKQAQTTDDIIDRIANARANTATEISEANASAGNYRKGRFNYHGLRISIENPKGSTRSGTSSSGKKWSNVMKSDYGYIRGTMGADGDPMDVFIGDDPKSEMVFIINQVNRGGDFDEHKVVLGALDAKQARQTYLANYKPGWTGCGSVISMTMPQFKQWLQGDTEKPAGEIKQAAASGAAWQEGGSFTHDGQVFDLDAALRETHGKPVLQRPVKDLSWILEHDRNVDPARLAAADTSAPLLTMQSRDGREAVVDGLHRLTKAHNAGDSTIGVRQFPHVATIPSRTRVVMPYGGGYLMERMNNPKYPANLGRQRFPGGGIDSGESSQQAAARELFEELGLTVDPAKLRSLGINSAAEHGPEEYFELPEHGLQPGNYTASTGGDKHIELIEGDTASPNYWGAQLNALQSAQQKAGSAVNPVAAIYAMAETEAWQQVPRQVAKLLKTAGDIKSQVQKVMAGLDAADPGYGYVYWHPKRNNLWAVLSDSDEQDSHDTWWEALSKIPGINKVITEAEVGPTGEHRDEWILIKKAKVFSKASGINPFTAAGKPFGGPNAVTNSVVGALIGGGLGYGGGRLAEALMPERHFERGRLSKNLALAGAVLGGTPGAVQGLTHLSMNANAGEPSVFRSFLQPTAAQKVAPNETAWRKHVLGKEASELPQEVQAAIARSAKTAADTMSGFGNPAMRPINVDEFNNAIWHDPYSPPAVNAAAAGIVTGIQQHYGGASVLTPRHFINGLAAAGVDYATATVAGGVLGVLGGLKPPAQQTLQQMGLWSGLLRGSIGSIFGQ